MMLYTVLLAIMSCSPVTGNIIAHETLEVVPNVLYFEGNASAQTVQVTTSFKDVTVCVSEDWCEAVLNEDNTRLTVSVEASDVVERTATLTLAAAKGKRATVAVTQLSEDDATTVRFGLIADIQYADKPNTGRYYRLSLEKLSECIDAFNEQQVQFVVNLGDLTDEDAPKNLGEVTARLKKSHSTVYNTTGNHDYGNVSDNEALYEQLDMPAEYYSFTIPGWRFIMLNTNEISEYANPYPEEQEELDRIRQRMKEEGRGYASYNGGISKKQMMWLERELEKSVREEVNTIVLSHHPLYGPNGLTALNDREIVALLSEYKSTVKCAIAGHHHSGDYGVSEGIPFITTEGMVDTQTNAYGIVTLTPYKIEVTGAGRTRSHTVRLK